MTEPGLTFDTIADDYDRYREAYPADFITDVLSTIPQRAPGRLCEIGCGSGQATIRLADIGFDITCVEPGTRLLDLARKRLERYSNVSFVESPFESAELSLSEFDVVFAAQSLHWVPAQFRFVRSAEILKPSGYMLAVWRWNHPLSGRLGTKLNAIFSENVPAYKIETIDEFEQGALGYFNELGASKRFRQCQVRRVPYGWNKDAELYVNWISTWSQLAALTEEERSRVCQMVRHEIDLAGGQIYESGETVIISGQKPDQG
jgi:ubiquinone/menaquinone biosynthesis C-methylase UbiE